MSWFFSLGKKIAWFSIIVFFSIRYEKKLRKIINIRYLISMFFLNSSIEETSNKKKIKKIKFIKLIIGKLNIKKKANNKKNLLNKILLK